MMTKHLNRAFALAAMMLLTSGAAAQSSHAAPAGKANAAPEANKAGEKPKAEQKPAANAGSPMAAAGAGDKNANGDTKDDHGVGKGQVDPAAREAERAARRNTQLEAERQEVRSVLHGPMNGAMKAELQRHARFVARLERIRTLATDAKDNDTINRVTKLLEKENARHQKMMSTFQTSEANAKTQPQGGQQ